MPKPPAKPQPAKPKVERKSFVLIPSDLCSYVSVRNDRGKLQWTLNRIRTGLLINKYTNYDGECYASREKLANELGMSKRALRDQLDWLESNKLITRDPEPPYTIKPTSRLIQRPTEKRFRPALTIAK